MADKARQMSNSILHDIENRIRRTYSARRNAIGRKWYEYMLRHKNAVQEAYDRIQAASTAQERAAAVKAYEVEVRNMTFNDNRYRAMLEDTTQRLADVNKVALDYINDRVPDIYRVNYNYGDPELDSLRIGGARAAIRFDMVDEHTVKRLIRDGDIKLPYKDLDKIKDARWNTRQLNSALLQGLLLGESMDKIAQRIYPIVGRNEDAAIRNARTMVTGAENAGRLDRYRSLQDEGAVMQKVWLASNDGRTRDWHADMDGQTVDVDAYFVDGLGNELEYPGDPGAPPETVYNCRCTMYSKPIGIKRSDGSIEYFDGEEGE